MAHNTKAKAPRPLRQTMTSSATPDMINHEGAPAYSRDPKSDLYLLASVDFGSDSYYESKETREQRLQELTRTVALVDPDWLVEFITWLRSRSGGAMRSAPLTIAAEAVHARLAAGQQGSVNAQMIRKAISRADEPGELVAYWLARFGTERNGSGQMKAKLPYPVKQGLKAAIEGLPDDEIKSVFTEYNSLKYDTTSRAVRFADVVTLVHPRALTDAQLQLYVWLADRRHGRALDGRHPVPALRMVHARERLSRQGADRDRIQRQRFMMSAANLKSTEAWLMHEAGVTWEWMASWYNQPLDRAFWTAMAPQLPYFALLRNLRNLDEAGIDDTLATRLATRLADRQQVLKSGIFPFQFLTAYHNVVNDRWLSCLSTAADHSVRNVPELPGRTLVLIDTSGSMDQHMATRESKGTRSDAPQSWRPARVDAAALFGAAWALKNPTNTDVAIFGNSSALHVVPKGTSLLRAVTGITRRVGDVGHGTEIALAIRQQYKSHDRVIIFTDEQTFGTSYGHFGRYNLSTVTDAVPASIPLYSFNLAGYAGSMLPLGEPNRVQLGGLTDKAFGAIPSYEAGRRAEWPWRQ